MRERVNAIKALRLSKNPPLRQEDLARQVGILRGHISRYELGEVEPSLSRAMEIARALRTPVERVFYGLAEAVDARHLEREERVSRGYGTTNDAPPASGPIT